MFGALAETVFDSLKKHTNSAETTLRKKRRKEEAEERKNINYVSTRQLASFHFEFEFK